MAHKDDIALIAHLMRVQDLAPVARNSKSASPRLEPPWRNCSPRRSLQSILIPCFLPAFGAAARRRAANGKRHYMYYLVTTQRPRREDGLFCTMCSPPQFKVDNYDQLLEQIDLSPAGMATTVTCCRRYRRTDDDLLLDNNQNHARR